MELYLKRYSQYTPEPYYRIIQNCFVSVSMDGSFQNLLYELLISLQILAATLFKKNRWTLFKHKIAKKKVDYSDFTEITLIVPP